MTKLFVEQPLASPRSAKELHLTLIISYQLSHITCHMSGFMCHISYFMCCVSPVTKRQQPQPHKLPLLTPPLCTVDWYAIMQTPKNLNIFQNSKRHQSGKKMKMEAIRSYTRSLQSTGKRVFHNGTDKHTTGPMQ